VCFLVAIKQKDKSVDTGDLVSDYGLVWDVRVKPLAQKQNQTRVTPTRVGDSIGQSVGFGGLSEDELAAILAMSGHAGRDCACWWWQCACGL